MRRSERVARVLTVLLAISLGALLLMRPDGRSSGAGGPVAPEAGDAALEPTGSMSDPELDLPAADPVAPAAEPIGILGDDGLVLSGSVPDAATAASLVRRLEDVLGPDGLIVQLTLDERVKGDVLRIDLVESVPTPADGGSIESLLATSTTLLEGFPDAKLVLVGHTDGVGTEATNLALSIAQAQVVANLLVDRGLPRERIEATGAGEVEPLALDDSPEGRRLNQRITASFEDISTR